MTTDLNPNAQHWDRATAASNTETDWQAMFPLTFSALVWCGIQKTAAVNVLRAIQHTFLLPLETLTLWFKLVVNDHQCFPVHHADTSQQKKMSGYLLEKIQVTQVTWRLLAWTLGLIISPCMDVPFLALELASFWPLGDFSFVQPTLFIFLCFQRGIWREQISSSIIETNQDLEHHKGHE